MKYIPTALYYFIGIVVVTLSTALAVRYILVLRHGRHDVLDQLTPALLAIAFAFAFPLSYIYGGVISSWYLWPSSVLVYYLVARLIETW